MSFTPCTFRGPLTLFVDGGRAADLVWLYDDQPSHIYKVETQLDLQAFGDGLFPYWNRVILQDVSTMRIIRGDGFLLSFDLDASEVAVRDLFGDWIPPVKAFHIDDAVPGFGSWEDVLASFVLFEAHILLK